ncbi:MULTISPECIES: hypothetical protein, partial [unclassified Bradyrhizobium]
LLSNPIRNLRPSRRLLSHVHSNSEARVSASRLPNDSRAARLIGIRSIARRSTMARFSNEEVTSNQAIAAIAIAPLQSQFSDPAEPGKRRYLHVDLHRLG